MNWIVGIIQVLLGLAGMLFGAWICSFTVGEGMPTVIGVWVFAFLVPYFVTRIAHRLLGRVASQRAKKNIL